MSTKGHPTLPFNEGYQTSSHTSPLLSVKELASYLDVPVKTIYTWRHRRGGPKGFRVGKHLRFRWNDVQVWLAERMAEEL